MMLRTAFKRLIGTISMATLCPVSLRIPLLRLCGAEIHDGAHIFPGCRFFTGQLRVGPRAMIAQECLLQDFSPITVGARTWIGPRSVLITQTHEIGDSGRRAARPLNRSIEVGNGCWLGANVTVLPGVTIGDGCIVGAGAVVTRDCEPNGLYVGVPARRVRDLP
jgi:maltose O-acetyltransferase